MKTVKIPLSLFELLCDFFDNMDIRSILCYLYNSDFIQLYDDLGTELRKKQDAMRRREAFSAYKSAADPDQREQLRREYLDQAQIPEGFRTSEEVDSEIL